jgi:hypothetical protein
MFVLSTGTVYLGTATTTATISQNLLFSSTLTVGTQIVGGYYYYGVGEYLTTYPQLAQYGTLNNNLIYPGLVITDLSDYWNTATNIAAGSSILIYGFTADPGQSFFSSITANNVTLNSTAASYSYFATLPGNAEQGLAIWSWPTTSQFGFKNISSTTVIISGMTQKTNQSVEQELSSYYPSRGLINLSSSTVRRLAQVSTGTVLLSQLRNRSLTNLVDHWIFSYNYYSVNYVCASSFTINLGTGVASAQSTINGYHTPGYPVTYPYQIWNGSSADRSLYSVRAIYSTSTTGTLVPTTGTLNTWYALTGGTVTWGLSTPSTADTHYHLTMKLDIKENSSGNIVDSCFVTLDTRTWIAASGGGGGGGGGTGPGGTIKPF